MIAVLPKSTRTITVVIKLFRIPDSVLGCFGPLPMTVPQPRNVTQ